MADTHNITIIDNEEIREEDLFKYTKGNRIGLFVGSICFSIVFLMSRINPRDFGAAAEGVVILCTLFGILIFLAGMLIIIMSLPKRVRRTVHYTTIKDETNEKGFRIVRVLS